MRPALQPTPAGFGTEPTETARTPASAYVVLNSRDRFANSTPGQRTVDPQPWNNFQLQRPQSLLEAFAHRIQVCEVRFPWYIPNVQARNRYFTIILDTAPSATYLRISIDEGFKTPTDIVNGINGSITAAEAVAGLPAGSGPVVSYSNGQYTFLKNGGSPRFALVQTTKLATFLDPLAPIATQYGYEMDPSLLQTIGMPLGALTWSYASPVWYSVGIQSDYTTSLYTDYVDIVSEKLNYYANVKDGGSGITTPRSLVCRLYASDEVSITTAQPVGTAPFVIHRQFKTPKSVEWDPTAFLDWLDIKVFDQYGDLVALPSNYTDIVTSYPDFQITLLASES